MIKKKRIRTINFSVKAEIILMKLNYLDGLKKLSKTKNLSDFISNLIIAKFDKPDIEEKYALFNLRNAQRKKDQAERELDKMAAYLRKLKRDKKTLPSSPAPPTPHPKKKKHEAKK